MDTILEKWAIISKGLYKGGKREGRWEFYLSSGVEMTMEQTVEGVRLEGSGIYKAGRKISD